MFYVVGTHESGLHLVSCVRTERRRGQDVLVGVLLCPVDSGAPQRYASTFYGRFEQITDQPVRIGCVGCRLAAVGSRQLEPLVCRPHGPLEPAHGI